MHSDKAMNPHQEFCKRLVKHLRSRLSIRAWNWARSSLRGIGKRKSRKRRDRKCGIDMNRAILLRNQTLPSSSTFLIHLVRSTTLFRYSFLFSREVNMIGQLPKML